MRLLLALFMLSTVVRAANFDRHKTIDDTCRMKIEGMDISQGALTQMRTLGFPSGHRTPIAAVVQDMNFEEFHRSLNDSLSQLAYHLAEGSVDLEGYVRQLHYDADIQVIYAGNYRGSIQSLRMILREHAAAVRHLHLFAGRHFADLTVHPALVSELVLIATSLSTLNVLDSAIDLLHLLLESEPFRAEIRDGERRATLLALLPMENANLQDHFDDAEYFRRMEHTFDLLSDFLDWDAGERNFHVLKQINESLNHVSVGHIAREHLKYIRAMSRRLPRYGGARGYHVIFAFRKNTIGDDFLTRHEGQLIRYDLNLYNFLIGAAGYPSAMAESYGKPN